MKQKQKILLLAMKMIACALITFLFSATAIAQKRGALLDQIKGKLGTVNSSTNSSQNDSSGGFKHR